MRRHARHVFGLMVLCALATLGMSACASGASHQTANAPSGVGKVTVPNSAGASTSTPVGFTGYDGNALDKMTIAYAFNGNIWVASHGAPPRQVTNFTYTAAQSSALQNAVWALAFSPDATHLLVELDSTSTTADWIVTFPQGTVTSVSHSLVNCGPQLAQCQWVDNRYIAFLRASHDQSQTPCTSHNTRLVVYDSQTQRDLSTAIADVCMITFQVRGSAIYIPTQPGQTGPGVTPVASSATSTATLENGVLDRYDIASNTVAPAFTASTPLLINGVASAAWDLSADGRTAVFSSGRNPRCTSNRTNCFAYYVTGDTSMPLFSQLSSLVGSGSCYSGAILSPDARTAALALTDDGTGHCKNEVLQQSAPNGQQLTNALPAPVTLIGWMPDNSNVLARTSALIPSPEVTLYMAPVGSGQAAHKIAEVPAQFAIAEVR